MSVLRITKGRAKEKERRGARDPIASVVLTYVCIPCKARVCILTKFKEDRREKVLDYGHYSIMTSLSARRAFRRTLTPFLSKTEGRPERRVDGQTDGSREDTLCFAQMIGPTGTSSTLWSRGDVSSSSLVAKLQRGAS